MTLYYHSQLLSTSRSRRFHAILRKAGPIIPLNSKHFYERETGRGYKPDDMAASSSTAMPPSIPVIFSTKTQYQLPPQKFMIPASWRRFQLSQLINTALALPRAVPFDFLIRGVLLGGSLSEAANGEVSRPLARSCDIREDMQIDGGVAGGNAGDRVHRERHAALKIGGASTRRMGLFHIIPRTRVCNLFRCFD
jgi:NLE (NUC135) domain